MLYVIGKLGADGADYRAVEFDGPAIRRLSVASRMVLANLAMEMGAKVAFTPVDDRLASVLARRIGKDKITRWTPDADASYERVLEIDAGRHHRTPGGLPARRG